MEWDVRESWMLCSPTPLEQEEWYSILKHAINLSQNRILQLWPLEPNIIVKIDVWVARKRSAQQIIFRRGDRESILKWNIAFAHYLTVQFLSQDPELFEAVSIGLISCLAFELEKLPINTFMRKLWNSFPLDKIPQNDLASTYDLLYCSVLFQVWFVWL